jgi:hypothetical protein
LSGSLSRTIFRVPVALADFFTQIFQHEALPVALQAGAQIGSLSHRRPDFIVVFSAGDGEAYALVGGSATNFVATFDVTLIG